MQVSAVSTASAVQVGGGVRVAAPTGGSAPPQADSVHLSAAAKAQVGGADADGDHDGH
jgi:hypothetical protein